MQHLKIKNFGPIANVDIALGDLTFFVGPQASGKSITLEALKLIEDRDSIIETLDRYNYIIGHNAKNILNVYFGEGMENIWKADTTIQLDQKLLTLNELCENSSGKESSVFYVPAQRIICMGDGYPKFFGDFSFTTPYVLREFTETLRTFLQFGLANKDKIFPIKGQLKEFQKQEFDKNIFHDGDVVITENAGQKKMALSVDGMKIPFMAWSAGQKEFMPLLLSFYCLLSSPSQIVKRQKFSTVIIEEPEMGLHPNAILSVLLQVCELLSLGYKVIISTHSSMFLEYAWAFNTLQNNCNNFHEALCALFEVKTSSAAGKILKQICSNSVKTYFFSRECDTKRVRSVDISSLDVTSDNPILSEWGQISEFSTHVNDIVSKYYNPQNG